MSKRKTPSQIRDEVKPHGSTRIAPKLTPLDSTDAASRQGFAPALLGGKHRSRTPRLFSNAALCRGRSPAHVRLIALYRITVDFNISSSICQAVSAELQSFLEYFDQSVQQLRRGEVGIMQLQTGGAVADEAGQQRRAMIAASFQLTQAFRALLP